MMEYRRLGNAGIQVSVLSLGSWVTFGKQVDESIAEDCMKTAYDAGINFFDNAEVYAHGKSEIVMGKVLKKMNWERDTYLVSSKVFWGTGGKLPNQRGLNRKHVIDACEQALKRLQVDYLDFYFCHRPDKDTPILETVFAMNALIQQGKILYWGTSEWRASQIMEAYWMADKYHLVPPQMEQPQYHLLERYKVEKEYTRLYELGMGTTVWSPLASGLLTGKYNETTPEDTRLSIQGMEWLKESVLQQDKIEKVRQLTALAKELGVSMTHLALAWVVRNPHVSTAILGASRVSQLKDNLGCLAVVPLLTEEVCERIESIVQNKPSVEQYL